ncbi:MAG TPA: tRNA adenosine deaminase-associated protein [Arachnia sp.]|nr:tRNA adenosine deaminase-associated protein [Arachnia sp.]HMT87224.1 tRNA adenosine deaminase-associated protein [Arachnia sp.]
MDVFDEDAEPFDLTDDLDEDETDDDYLDDLEDATEEDVDLVVALYREDGQAVAVPLEVELANDLEELIEQLRRLPGDSGADGWVAIDGDVFVICRVRGRTVEVLLNDATAALDWPIARDVVDYLGEDVLEDDDPAPVGDLEIYSASGLGAFEMEAIATDYEADAYDQLALIARKLRVEDEFLGAADEFGD